MRWLFNLGQHCVADKIRQMKDARIWVFVVQTINQNDRNKTFQFSIIVDDTTYAGMECKDTVTNIVELNGEVIQTSSNIV